ncbi:ABC transporter ATP-binding protein [Desertimonas flava]|jgi:ABC-2 type transport system ATP-binding protein|uniref:ABC transporter ATP-binding protein n=1 Tax=Desertimonas flava TaxID=2064846 RepID=UPI001878523E|nr:ATP-binding cassette domain-containing protein [Desertimonas flava]
MIELTQLSKRYGDVVAVDGISFTCRPGTVTGFLGPNGAGKSTALRMLTGLTVPTSGRATIGGIRYADLPNPGRLVGVMLDATAQHAGRTGVETLRLAAAVMGLPPARASDMLEAVGLGAAAARRVGDYSLGMRQRLGIGAALLGDPAVLVLDEPANGMDPEGIRWMRVLLHDFAAGGGTVLLSSHLLGEVQATVDHLVVIGRGRVVADDRLDVLLARRGTTVRSIDDEALAGDLRRAGIGVERAGTALRADASAEQVGRIAASGGHVLLELRDADGSALEDLFFELTSSDEVAA